MNVRTKYLFFGFALLLVSAVASAGMVDSGLMSKLHNASNDIKQYTNHGSVVESIYKQIRPRANITNATLSGTEIDRIVRAYVSEKYAPALVANYAQLYAQLKAANADFSTCDALHPFKLTKDVLLALCIKSDGSTIRVEYRTNGYGKGWSTSAIYTFADDGDALRLNEINIFIKDGAKAYVEGL